MHKFIAALFALSCFGTSALSGSIMGPGVWFWVIIAAGAFVLFSQFVSILRSVGAGIALLTSMISILAVLLGLLAATVGGSFRLEEREALLLFLFFINALLGVTLAIMFNRSIKRMDA